ncbi:seminal metalloprotease 1-like [Cochliomyia hominivorax]
MKYYQSFILLALLLVNCYGAPLEDIEEEDPELIGGDFEGDILLDNSRNGLRNENRRWPGGIVYYKIGDEYDHKNYILEAMNDIESASCVRFKPATEDTIGYIDITSSKKGCSSFVGYFNRAQNVNLEISELGKGCFRKGTIQHELLHALGFEHQHSAPDRDNFIKIVWENIKKDKHNQFRKRSEQTVTDFGVDYDFGSVMHYGPRAFTKNNKKTIIPLGDENIEIGQRRRVSDRDIKKLNLMYKCDN